MEDFSKQKEPQFDWIWNEYRQADEESFMWNSSHWKMNSDEMKCLPRNTRKKFADIKRVKAPFGDYPEKIHNWEL